MRVALLTADSREVLREYSLAEPSFGTAPEALIQGFAQTPDAEIHVISCVQRPMLSPEKLAPNVWYHGLVVPKIGWLRTGYQGCIRTVRRKLKQLQPDIVHGQGTERDCALSAVFSGFPNVLTIHGNMAKLARVFRSRLGSFNWCAARLENFSLQRTLGVFCNSAYTEALVRPRARKVWRVPNAVREPFFTTPKVPAAGVAARRCVLLNVGEISPRKRQVELLTQAGEWHRQGARFELIFVGPPPAPDACGRRFVELLGPAERVGYARHAGVKPSNELIALFDQAGALVHFPSEEAFGLVAAEALARGLKLFGARVGGIPEIAAGATDAELFDANDWAGLGIAVLRWTAAGGPAMASAAQAMRARYLPRVVARQHLEIYGEALGCYQALVNRSGPARRRSEPR